MVAGPVGLGDVVAGSLSVGLLVTRADGELVWVNDAARDLVGDDVSALLSALAPAPRPGERRELRWTSGRKDRWLDVECLALDADLGEGSLVLQLSDGTERHRLVERARDSGRRLSQVETLTRTGSWEWDVSTNEVAWSDELRRMCGYTADADLSYAAYCSHVHPDDVARVEQALAEALHTGRSFRYVHRMRPRGSDTELVFDCSGEVLPGPGGRPARLVVTARDITGQPAVLDALAGLPDHDSLTGLLDRRAVVGRLRDRLAAGVRGGALLVVGLDGFKDVNALRGHSVGDGVLRSVAELLRRRAQPGAILGRLGGDEFAVVLPAGNAGDSLEAAEALREAIAAHACSDEGGPVRVTASIGVAPLAPTGDCDILLANADLALYEAKGAGRNQARVFAPEQYQVAVRRVSVLQRVQDALEAGLMAVDAQPIVDLATGRVTSHELLIRLRDGKDPALGPGEFLPPVERTDLVHHLDRWMIEQAVVALGSSRARRERLHLHVNVSARSLEDPRFGDYVVSTLRDGGVEPPRLGLEITETAALTNLSAARRLASRLTRAGCRFALDDFGAGFGSFAYLKHLPFTSIKIDGEFVRQADRARGDAVFVQAVVTVARGLNMLTVAEYVDREPLVTTLTKLGVDRAQGFHLGRPRPLSEIIDG